MADVQHFAGVFSPVATSAVRCGSHISWGSAPSTTDPWGLWWDTDDACLKINDAAGNPHVFIPSVNGLKRSITIHIDGGASEPSTGVKQRWSAPCNCTITGWVLVADAAGSAVIDVLRSTYAGFPTTVSIAGTDKPMLAVVQKNENLTLAVWGSVAILAGDILEFDLSSVTTCKMLDLTLNFTIAQ